MNNNKEELKSTIRTAVFEALVLFTAVLIFTASVIKVVILIFESSPNH